MRKLAVFTVLLGAAALLAPPPVVRGQGAPDATTFGGTGTDVAGAIAVDVHDHIYIGGRSNSPNLPGTQGAFQRAPVGIDAFVAKLKWNGDVVWTTFLGGRDVSTSRFGVSVDEVKALAVDAQGNVYVGGSTASADFPTQNAYQAVKRSPTLDRDGFLAKFDPTGSRLIYSTFLGAGDGSSSVEAIAVGPAGDVAVALQVDGRQFDVTRDFSAVSARNIVVGRFQPSGSLLWLARTGYGETVLNGFTVDGAGRLNVSGYSPTMPCSVTATLLTTCAGTFVQQIDPAGVTARLTSVLVGAGSPQRGDQAAMVDDRIVLAGPALPSLPLMSPWQSEPEPLGNGYAAALDAGGARETVTFLGAAEGRIHTAADPLGGLHLAYASIGALHGPAGATVPQHPAGPVYQSADRGDSWAWASHGLVGSPYAAAIDRQRALMYVGTPAGLFRRPLEDESFSLWYSDPTRIYTPILVDPRDPTTTYVGDGSGGLVRLDQDGRSRTVLKAIRPSEGLFPVRAMAANPHDGSVWASSRGLEVSFDRGATWTRRDTGFPDLTPGLPDIANEIVFDRRRRGIMLVTLRNHLYRSVDDGLSWAPITDAIPGFGSPGSVAIDPVDSARIYVEDGRRRQLLVTGDDGRTWTTLLVDVDVASLIISDVAPHRITISATNVVTRQSGVFVSETRGATWSFRAAHPPATLFSHPRDTDQVLALQRVNSLPYVMRMERRPASRDYVRTHAEFLDSGSLAGVAASRDGRSVVAVNTEEIRVIRVGR